MGGLTLRTISAGERDAVLDLLAGWLGDRAFFARYFAHDPSFRDDLCFVAETGGRLVSTLQVFRRRVRVGGAVLEVGAVGNVFTDPAHRAGGLASALLERAIAAMRAHGFDASLLFASRLDFYGRLGWRSHPRRLSYIAPASGPAPGGVEPFDAARDLDAVAEVYAAYSHPVDGATARDTACWRGQLRYAGNPDERFVVARRAGRVAAYARATPLYELDTVIEHGCRAGETEALADCLVALHAAAPHRSGTLAQLAPDAALAAALARRGLAISDVDDPSWMWRVIDAERLAARLRLPEAAVRGEAFFADLLPVGRSRYWIADRF